MSDSDSDETFESADEGEDFPQNLQVASNQKHVETSQDDFHVPTVKRTPEELSSNDSKVIVQPNDASTDDKDCMKLKEIPTLLENLSLNEQKAAIELITVDKLEYDKNVLARSQDHASSEKICKRASDDFSNEKQKSKDESSDISEKVKKETDGKPRASLVDETSSDARSIISSGNDTSEGKSSKAVIDCKPQKSDEENKISEPSKSQNSTCSKNQSSDFDKTITDAQPTVVQSTVQHGSDLQTLSDNAELNLFTSKAVVHESSSTSDSKVSTISHEQERKGIKEIKDKAVEDASLDPCSSPKIHADQAKSINLKATLSCYKNETKQPSQTDSKPQLIKFGISEVFKTEEISPDASKLDVSHATSVDEVQSTMESYEIDPNSPKHNTLKDCKPHSSKPKPSVELKDPEKAFDSCRTGNLEFDDHHFVVDKDVYKSTFAKTNEIETDEAGNDSWDVGWEVDDIDIDQILDETEQSKQHHSNPSTHADEENKPVHTPVNALENVAVNKEKMQAGWGWGNWGSSILSTATASVSTFSDHVGQGLGSVINSVESTLGAPSAEELAALSRKQNENKIEQPTLSHFQETESAFKLGTLFTGVSSIIETTGNKVLEGGVGALEKIGKKTIDIITEGDPGLKKKRAMLSGNRPVLSQVLRQAKEQSEKDDQVFVDEENTAVTFPMMFDRYNGLMYLEALEMLSEQCRLKMESKAFLLTFSDEAKCIDMLSKIEELCLDSPIDEVDNQEDFDVAMTEYYRILNINYSPSKLIDVRNEEKLKSENIDCLSAKECFESVISTQAILTSAAIQQLHKVADLILIDKKTNKILQTEAIVGIASCICNEIETLSTFYAETLIKTKDSSEDVDHLTTNIYFEMSNSTSYIHDALRLMTQVLKLAILSP